MCKIKKKYLVGVGVLIVVAVAFVCLRHGHEGTDAKEMSERYRSMVHDMFMDKARQYGADTRYLIIVDYSIPSNKDRMFLWDTKCDGIVEMFWCAHGFGGGSTPEKPVFSNTVGSNCSSLGWFLVDNNVGKSPHWGYHYHAVDGLESSNSNARQRQILIHPWWKVTRDHAFHISSPMDLDGRSAGCFTTSGDGFDTLDKYITSRHKRILLWAMRM